MNIYLEKGFGRTNNSAFFFFLRMLPWRRNQTEMTIAGEIDQVKGNTVSL